MAHIPRRRLRGRRLARPTPAAFPQPPAQDPNNGSTEFKLVEVGAPAPSPALHPQQESTVELAAINPLADPKGETLGSLAELPPPPPRLEFSCPCGARLVATKETYDKHSRCAMCNTVLLLNLVYDPDREAHEIVPFRARIE
jgi:hypothetical protein